MKRSMSAGHDAGLRPATANDRKPTDGIGVAAAAVFCLAAATVMGLAARPAAAEPFTLLVYERADQLALRSDTGARGKAYWDAYAEAGKAMQAANVLRGGAPLDLPKTASTVRRLNVSKAHVSPGSPTTGPLSLGGFFIIDVADRAAAEVWAARLPAAQTGAVEVRPNIASPTM